MWIHKKKRIGSSLKYILFIIELFDDVLIVTYYFYEIVVIFVYINNGLVYSILLKSIFPIFYDLCDLFVDKSYVVNKLLDFFGYLIFILEFG